jgi:RAB protein geranylgeranyltransferase component A
MLTLTSTLTQPSTAPPGESLLAFFERAFSLSASLAASLAYALAHTSSPSSEALPALVRMRSYLRAVGKYGNSPFLVGQYGGAGEVVQGFARLGAVQGAIFILANPVESVTTRVDDDKNPIELQIKGFSHPLCGKHLVAHPDYLPDALRGSPSSAASESDSRFARLVAVFDALPDLVPLLPPGPVEDGSDEDGVDNQEKQPDTALLVFPPGSLVADVQRTVQVVLMGEGTGSCPKDHCASETLCRIFFLAPSS